MALQRGTFSGTLAADAYRNLMDLLGVGLFTTADIVGGVLQAQTFGLTVRIVARGSPAPITTDPGTTLASGAGIGLQQSDQWALDEIWVRNTTAGSNAVAVFTGTLET